MEPAGSGRPAPEASPLDESALAEGLTRGDRRAVSEFLDRTHHPVFCMACRLTREHDLRREWTHETLIGVLEDLRKGRFVYRRPGSFWAWFRKRAYFRLLDECRRHGRRLHREAPASESASGETLDLPGGEDPLEEMSRVETLAALERCLASLPNADQRRALDLLLFQGMAYQEIADSMAAPLNTVKAWIRRGRLAVRRCVAAALGWTEAGGSGE